MNFADLIVLIGLALHRLHLDFLFGICYLAVVSGMILGVYGFSVLHNCSLLLQVTLYVRDVTCF